MKILFVQPPDIHRESFDLATARRGRYPNYPPYGLGLLAAIAEEKGHRCRIVNCQDAVLSKAGKEDFDFDKSWQEALEGVVPDLICLTCMFSQAHKSFQRVSNYLSLRYHGVQQVAGGVHVTNSIEELSTRGRFKRDFPHISRFFLHEGDAEFGAFVGNEKGENLDRRPAWHLMDPRISSRNGKVGAFYYMLENPCVATILSNGSYVSIVNVRGAVPG